MNQIRSINEIEEGLKWLVEKDPRLEPIAEQVHDVPLRLLSPGFASLARIIVGQQVSTASAAAIWGRINDLVSPFEPASILTTEESKWREAGLSRPKQKCLVRLAATLHQGQVKLEEIQKLDTNEAVARLTQIHGIGPWTAEVYLLFCAGHPDLFPTRDLALQIAVQKGLGLDNRPNPDTLNTIAQKWSPWRGVASRLFWAYYGQIIKGKSALPV